MQIYHTSDDRYRVVRRRLARARAAVNADKIGLGERGPVWWDDGAKDYNRHLVKNIPYATWYEEAGGE